MKKEFTYVCVLEHHAGEKSITAYFPDLEEAYTDGENTEEVIKFAKEVLTLTLKSRIADNENIPKQTDLMNIKLKEGQYTSLITVNIEEKIKYDKKTLTIPHDLNIKAEAAGINFSQVLQYALQEKLTSKS